MAGENEDPKGDPKGTPEVKKEEVKKTDSDEKVTISKSELEKLKSSLHDSNEEAKKFRLEGKGHKEKADRFEKAFKIATGKEDEPDPAKMEKEKLDSRMRKLMVKSAFVSAAAGDMHDAEHSFDSVVDDLGDIEVDIEKGTVDRKVIKERLEELKKNRPYLFKQKIDPAKKDPKAPAGQKEEGTPSDNENPYTKWQGLFAKDKKAATEFYKKNRDAIAANMPK